MATHTRVFKFRKLRCQSTKLGAILRWCLQENVPEFPFTAGLYPFKREGEKIRYRMFAGQETLYGCRRRAIHTSDIYGKNQRCGVSICCLDDAKKLYSGFDLVHAMSEYDY
jgi:methylmalonyl-CoA mutase